MAGELGHIAGTVGLATVHAVKSPAPAVQRTLAVGAARRPLRVARAVPCFLARRRGAGQRELNKGVALGGARGVADHEAALQGAVRDASGAQPGVGAVLAARVGQEEADLQER